MRWCGELENLFWYIKTNWLRDRKKILIYTHLSSCVVFIHILILLHYLHLTSFSFARAFRSNSQSFLGLVCFESKFNNIARQKRDLIYIFGLLTDCLTDRVLPISN